MKVRIYSKKDCHLCDVAKDKLQEFAGRFPLDIEEIDIEQDPQAHELYKYEIPVVFLEDRKLFKYRIDDAKFEQALRSRMNTL